MRYLLVLVQAWEDFQAQHPERAIWIKRAAVAC